MELENELTELISLLNMTTMPKAVTIFQKDLFIANNILANLTTVLDERGSYTHMVCTLSYLRTMI